MLFAWNTRQHHGQEFHIPTIINISTNILILVLCWRDVSSPVVIRSHCIKHRDQSDMDYRPEFPPAATVRVSIHLICFAWIDFWYLHHSIKTFRQNIFEHICKKINICHVLRLQSGLFCHPNIIAMKNIVSIYIYILSTKSITSKECRMYLLRHRGSCIYNFLLLIYITLQRRSVDVSSSILSYFWLSSSNRLV